MVVQPLSDAPKLIRIIAAVIRDDRVRTLLVRKRGATVSQLPGGKREPGDVDQLATLAREPREEPGCELVPASARILCHCSAPAANEPDHRVAAAVYTVQVRGVLAAQAEIEELRWVDPSAPAVPLATLSRKHPPAAALAA